MAQRPLLLLTPLAAVALAAGWFGAPEQDGDKVILETPIHLGDDDTPEWPEAAAPPDALREWAFEFELDAAEVAAMTGKGPGAMRLTARHVNGAWSVELNGTAFGTLPTGDERREHLFVVPADLLQVGVNRMRISIEQGGDDITVGPISLVPTSFRELLDLVPLRFRVVDEAGEGIPARLTVVSGPERDRRLVLYRPDEGGEHLRPGATYTDAAGHAAFEVTAGKEVTVYATRGPEWSVAEARLTSAADGPVTELVLRKEVDTDGWLSVDTHIHTYTFSGHGDSSVEERVRSLAGEALDIAIATDHNHQTDYREWQAEAGMSPFYRSIIGNEVTTNIGHFNAFPFPPGGPIPDASLVDWGALMAEIRSRGAEAIILNHPRWPDRKEGPYGVSGLDVRTGRFADGLRLPVDAMEVINSTTPEVPWQELRQDWFSLLNAGRRLRGVGSSDSHTVWDPVGQGRTWIAASSDDPHQVSDEEVAAAIREGRSSIGLGLFARLEVDGVGPGALLPVGDDDVEVVLTLALPSWAAVELVEVHLDGEEVARVALEDQAGQAREKEIRLTVPVPAHDAWMVVSASGPKPSEAWWTCAFDDIAWISNPVWLDRDRDGGYLPPSDSAARLLRGLFTDDAGRPQKEGLRDLLTRVDRAVAVQMFLAIEDRWGAEAPDYLASLPALAPEALRPTFEDLLRRSE
ncbi:MAG: CehA/McbA family metallohydrolase [Planctomycetota bacterium]|jgi:hypothetical protein